MVPKDITEVIFADGVEVIKNHAFRNCDSLTSIQIQDTVKRIEQFTFYRCDSLNNIKLPKHLESIGKTAFYNCESLDSVHIQDTVKEIEREAFDACYNLKIINIQPPLTTYGPSVFSNCNCLLTGSPVKCGSDYNRCTYIVNNDEVYEWLQHRWEDAPLHSVCNNDNVTLQKIEECIKNHGKECTHKVDNASTLGTRISHIYVIWETICVIW